MRVLVLVEPRFELPLGQLPAMTQGFVDWRQRYRDKMESFFFFVGGGGGGIINVSDEAELHQMFLDWPFTFFSKLDFRPIVDGDLALQQFQQTIQQMAQMGGGGGGQ